MIWSIFMHAIMGYFGTAVFTWTTQGILIAVAVALATQGVNLLQLKRDLLKKATEETEANHKRAVMEWKENNRKERGKGKGNAGSKPEKVIITVENMKQVLITAAVGSCTLQTSTPMSITAEHIETERKHAHL